MALRKYRKALRYLDICWEKEGIDEGRNCKIFCNINGSEIYLFLRTYKLRWNLDLSVKYVSCELQLCLFILQIGAHI